MSVGWHDIQCRQRDQRCGWPWADASCMVSAGFLVPLWAEFALEQVLRRCSLRSTRQQWRPHVANRNPARPQLVATSTVGWADSIHTSQCSDLPTIHLPAPPPSQNQRSPMDYWLLSGLSKCPLALVRSHPALWKKERSHLYLHRYFKFTKNFPLWLLSHHLNQVLTQTSPPMPWSCVTGQFWSQQPCRIFRTRIISFTDMKCKLGKSKPVAQVFALRSTVCQPCPMDIFLLMLSHPPGPRGLPTSTPNMGSSCLSGPDCLANFFWPAVSSSHGDMDPAGTDSPCLAKASPPPPQASPHLQALNV